MPVSYSFRGRLFRLDLAGVYPPSEIKEQFTRALSDPAFPEDAAFLMDVSRSESMAERKPEQIKEIAQFPAPWADRFGGRIAVLAGSKLYYGLCRMGAAYSEIAGLEVEIFKDVDTALAWLGVSSDGESLDVGDDRGAS
jgi:hypothetical protein